MEKIEIEICHRLDGTWRAQIKDHPEYWGCGRNQYEAAGNLIMAHLDVFNISMSCIYGSYR
jgi:hypothetical protein